MQNCSLDSFKLMFCYFAGLVICCAGCGATHTSRGAFEKQPFKIKVITGSREIVMRQSFPWEEQMMGYYKVLNTSPGYWQMWYSGWDTKRQDDYSGYLLYADSKDGLNWNKKLPNSAKNILKGTGHPQKDGVVEQDVFIVPEQYYKYKMIYTAKDPEDSGKEKTFVEESTDGIQWVHKKVLWNRKHDSQFSVIQKNDRFYIYLRYWNTFDHTHYRSIGLAITDKDWNTIQEPSNIFTADIKSEFPHLYDPAASKVNADLDILFPTFFNEKNNKVRIGVLYVYKNKPCYTNIDLTDDLLERAKNNWAIVSPGLIAIGKNTYWLYYYATNMVHSDYNKAGRLFNYYRVKIRIDPK